MSDQLPLAIVMDDAATFDNFFQMPQNQEAVAYLQSLLSPEQGVLGAYLWGGAGTGKSHLLQAICHESDEQARYIPLGELLNYPPEAVLEACELPPLVVIDDVHRLAGNTAWQEALFHLFNRRRDHGRPMVYAGNCAPGALSGVLPDFCSRLASLMVYRLPNYDEQALGQLLGFRGALRGIRLSPEVIRYIMARVPRTSMAVMSLLDRIDEVTLAHKRSLTIPLLQELKLLSMGR